MKLIISLFTVFIFTQQCNNTNRKTEENTDAQDAIEIVYEASTRGFYEKIILNKKEITVTKNRNGNAFTKECSQEDWDEIIKLLDALDAEKIKKNYVNADDLGRDAVIPATLYINYKENAVTIVTFGHGNTPKILQPLMTKIEAMVNAVDKP